MNENNDSPEQMDLKSMDIAAENKTKLKTLFPSVFTETRNEKGELVESIDFEKLKAELGTFSDLFELRRERYGMDWPGKKDFMKLIQQPSVATLKPCREESVNFDETENLFIQGENLEVLKLLQKSYYGKVKMIYIDPPYNTGKEFIYPDNFHDNLKNYLELTGQVDSDGRKLSANVETSGRYHTNWLNMMYPRLYLARNLLKEDGVMFISIDDNEVSNLRKLCDEIFGEENFVANVIWEKKYSPQNDAKWFSDNHDHLIVYAKDKEIWRPFLLPRSAEAIARYKNPDNDPRGRWKAADLSVKTYSETYDYPITTPNGRVIKPPKGRCWSMPKAKLAELIADNRISFGKDADNVPAVKKFLSEVKEGVTPLTIWKRGEVGDNQEARRVIRSLFGDISYFDTPKSVGLIKRALILATEENDIVLDFFSGSSTTAHAVLNLNIDDSGNRKFIMVQLPEPCDVISEAYKAGYKTIADIGKERIRRVIKKIEPEQAQKVKEEASKLPGMREELSELDLGFKVLKLDKSNFKVWDGAKTDVTEEELVENLELFVEHIDPGATQEDILFELLLKAGFMPTEKVEKQEMAGKTVFSIAEGVLLICLEDDITPELIDAVAQAEPKQFICLDRGFKGNDQLKSNAVQTFATRNQGRDIVEQIVFRTV